MEFASVKSWVEKQDPSTGRTYWGNLATKETTWKEPEIVARWRSSSRDNSYYEVFDEKTGKPYYVCEKSHSTTWIKPLGKIMQSPQGQDKAKISTGSTTTTTTTKKNNENKIKQTLPKVNLPEEEEETKQEEKEQWVECFDGTRNKPYYFNPATKKTTWKRPSEETCDIINADDWQKIQEEAKEKQEHAKDLPKQEQMQQEQQQVVKSEEVPTEEVTSPHRLVRKEAEAESTAVINDDASVTGWISRRIEDQERYEKLFFSLQGTSFTAKQRDDESCAVMDTFEVEPFTIATLSEDELAQDFTFVIELSSPETKTWFLGLDSIEDMQLWLEAFQMHVRKSRVASSADLVTPPPSSGGTSSTEFSALTRRRSPSTRRKDRRGSNNGRPLIGYLSTTQEVEEAAAEKERDVSGTSTGDDINTFESWATKNGFQELIPDFSKAGYDDLELIAQLNDDDLKEMLEQHIKLEKPGHRMKIVLAVRALRG